MVPVYNGAGPFPTTFLACRPMCCVCNRVLTTQSGFVTHIVATPAPDAESMWTIGGLIHAMSADTHRRNASTSHVKFYRDCTWLEQSRGMHLNSLLCIVLWPASQSSVWMLFSNPT